MEKHREITSREKSPLWPASSQNKLIKRHVPLCSAYSSFLWDKQRLGAQSSLSLGEGKAGGRQQMGNCEHLVRHNGIDLGITPKQESVMVLSVT